jgi:hypothetical protein
MSRLYALRATVVALTLSSALLLAGCAKSVVGKWKTDLALPTGGSMPITTEFKPDGNFEQNGQMSAPVVGNVNILAKGTYKVEGDKLNMNVADVTVNGRSLNNMPQIKNQANMSGTFKINGDSLEVSSAGKTQTMTRVKE